MKVTNELRYYAESMLIMSLYIFIILLGAATLGGILISNWDLMISYGAAFIICIILERCIYKWEYTDPFMIMIWILLFTTSILVVAIKLI